jgi:hypothetical protein
MVTNKGWLSLQLIVFDNALIQIPFAKCIFRYNSYMTFLVHRIIKIRHTHPRKWEFEGRSVH